MDRYVPPFLDLRRGWLIITQIGLLLAIGGMALQVPSRMLQLLTFNAVLIAFFSASQDVVFDAYRVDVPGERDMGAAAAKFPVVPRSLAAGAAAGPFLFSSTQAASLPLPRAEYVRACRL